MRRGRNEQRAIVREQRFGEGECDGKAAVVVDGDVGSVLVKKVVVEYVPAVFRSADIHVHQEVDGLYLGSVRIAGIRIQFEVNSAPVWGFRPFMSDSRNDFSRNRMDGNEADDDFIIQGAAETAVAVRAVGPECVGIGAGGPLAQHASFFGVRVPYLRIVQSILPLQVLGDVRRGFEFDVVAFRLPAVNDGQGGFIRNELALQFFPDFRIFLFKKLVPELPYFLLLGSFLTSQAVIDLFVPSFREGIKSRWECAEGYVRLPAYPLGLGGILATGPGCQQKGQHHGRKGGTEEGGQLKHKKWQSGSLFIYKW